MKNKNVKYIGSELEVAQYAKRWKKYFAKKLIPFIRGQTLEVGAGLGANTPYLSVNHESITSWCLLEPDYDLYNQIKDTISDLNLPHREILNGTIDDLGNRTFDTIIYIDVLEHIQDSKQEIEKIKKRLKPEGHLIILVPTFNFLYNEFDKQVGHFRRYNKPLLLQEINDSFQKKKLFYLDSIGFFASLANRLFLHQANLTKENVLFWDKYLVCLSQIFDILFCHSFGKSLIGIFINSTQKKCA